MGCAVREWAPSIDTHRRGPDEIVLRGLSICPGIGIGSIHVAGRDLFVEATDVVAEQVAAEQQRYTAAVGAAMGRLHEHVAIDHGDLAPEIKAILEIHQAILGDESLHDQVRKRIAADQKSAEWCLWQEASALLAQFSAMRDPYFEARGEDIRDMAHNLIGILSGTQEETGGPSGPKQVLVSRHLHSSDAILAHRSQGCGFASESRALMSHAAILLKGFCIPSVGGIKGLLDVAHEGDGIIVDGTTGVVVVRPSAATVEKFRIRKDAAESAPKTTDIVSCATADGTEIVLRANIENVEQVNLMLAHGLNGIGLFRTEFLVSAEGRMPTEEEQYKAYRKVIESAGDRAVVMRTFDIGGDKSMGLLSKCTGRNPSLGLRGIRRHLTYRPEELRTQLRAILRAALGANVEILIPMVTTAEDIAATKQHLAAARDELHNTGMTYSSDVVLGAMIETPAAAASVGGIFSEVDSVSVGTNDLLQYFMAADRDNESVIHYQDGTSPAFLWLMEHIIKQAREMGHESDVTVCGEVASDMRVVPHLLRMGYRCFSVSPVSATLFRDTCAEFSVDWGYIEKVGPGRC